MQNMDEVYEAARNFLRQSVRKVLLITGDNLDTSDFQYLMTRAAESENCVPLVIDVSQSQNIDFILKDVPFDQPMTFIFIGTSGENLYVKYDLNRWQQAKVVSIYDKSLLHPTLDPSIYFAPIKGNKIQRHLLCIIAVQSLAPAARSSASTKKTSVASIYEGSASLKSNRLSSHFLNQKLMTNDTLMMQMLADRILENDNYKAFLFNMIYATRNDDAMQIAAAHAITALNRAKIPLSGRDLSKIKIMGADLSDAILDNTQFQYADLRKVRFHGAWLRYANFEGALMEEVNFGWPYLPLKTITSSSCEITALCCCYSRDGKQIAVADGQDIQIYDVATLTLMLTLEGHTKTVTDLAFSPTESILASASYDNTIRIWSIQENKCIRIFEGHSKEVTSVAFSPDGLILVSGSWDKTIRLWIVENGVCFKILDDHSDGINSVSFNPNGKQFASSGHDKSIRLWSAITYICEKILEGHTDTVDSISFSPGGERLASGSWDNTVRVWSVTSGECEKIFKDHAASVRCIAFNPNGKQLASACGGYHSTDNTVRLWSLEDGACEITYEGHSAPVWCVAYSPCGKQIASTSQDNSTRLWSAIVENNERHVDGHTHVITSVTIDSRGITLASGSADTTVRLWSIKTGQCEKTLRGHLEGVRCIAFSPNGLLLASGCGGGYPMMNKENAIRLWSVVDGKCLRVLEGHNAPIHTVAFSPNGELLASGSGYHPFPSSDPDFSVRLWSVASGDCLQVLEGHQKVVRKVAFSPDGEILLSESDDHVVLVWLVEFGECIRMFIDCALPVNGPVFDADGSLLLEDAYNRNARYPDRKRIVSHLRNLPMVHDGYWFTNEQNGEQYLATGHADASVRFWRINKLQLQLVWTSKQGDLNVEGANIDNVTGLSSINVYLLKQRGTTGNPIEKQIVRNPAVEKDGAEINTDMNKHTFEATLGNIQRDVSKLLPFLQNQRSSQEHTSDITTSNTDKKTMLRPS